MKQSYEFKTFLYWTQLSKKTKKVQKIFWRPTNHFIELIQFTKGNHMMEFLAVETMLFNN